MEETKRERGMGRIWKIGFKEEPTDPAELTVWKKRIWWIQYYDASGRQRRESSGSTTKKVAEKRLTRRLTEKESGTLPTHQARGLAYEDLRDAYYAEYQMFSRKSLRFDKSGERYTSPVVRLDGFFSGYRVSQITTDAIREFILKLQGDELANQTVNHSLNALKKMFNVAKREAKVRDVPYFPMLKATPPRKGLLAHEKYPELLKSLPDYLRPVLALAYHTGMRRGEVVNLKWPGVDFIERVVRLNADETKNGSAREIPLSEELRVLLENQFVKRDPRCPFVCFRTELGKTLPIGDFRKVWKSRCDKLGIGGLRLHDLRRTFITDAENAGAPRHEVMGMTGHKTESAYKRYAIGGSQGRRTVMDQISTRRAELNGAKSGQIAETPKPKAASIS